MVFNCCNIGSLLLIFTMVTMQAMDMDNDEGKEKKLLESSDGGGHRRNRSVTIQVEGGVRSLEELMRGRNSSEKLAAIKQLLDSVAMQMGDVDRGDSTNDQVTITVRRPCCSWQSALRWGIGTTILAGAGVGVWYATQAFKDAKDTCNNLEDDAEEVIKDLKGFMPMFADLQQIIANCPAAGKLQMLKGFEICCKGKS